MKVWALNEVCLLNYQSTSTQRQTFNIPCSSPPPPPRKEGYSLYGGGYTSWGIWLLRENGVSWFLSLPTQYLVFGNISSGNASCPPVIIFINFITRVFKMDAVFFRCVKGVPFSMKGAQMAKLFCQNGLQKGKGLDLGTMLPRKNRTRVPLAYNAGVFWWTSRRILIRQVPSWIQTRKRRKQILRE